MKRWLWFLVMALGMVQQAAAGECVSAPSAIVLSEHDVVLAVPLLVEAPVVVEQRVIVRERVIVERRARPVRRFFGRLLRRR